MAESGPERQRAFVQQAWTGVAMLGCVVYAVWTRHAPTPGEWVWAAALALTIIIRAPHARAAMATPITEQRMDASERFALASMFVCMVALPAVAVTTPLFDAFAYTLPDWALWIGVALALLGAFMFWRSHADLGRNWSPALELREGHTLVTHGVYRLVRHPMYAAIWLQSAAQPLLVQNWIGGALILPACAFLYFSRVPKEEAMMAEQFGDVWRAYAARTARIAPGLRWL